MSIHHFASIVWLLARPRLGLWICLPSTACFRGANKKHMSLYGNSGCLGEQMLQSAVKEPHTSFKAKPKLPANPHTRMHHLTLGPVSGLGSRVFGFCPEISNPKRRTAESMPFRSPPLGAPEPSGSLQPPPEACPSSPHVIPLLLQYGVSRSSQF